jgi:hypothetical protein
LSLKVIFQKNEGVIFIFLRNHYDDDDSYNERHAAEAVAQDHSFICKFKKKEENPFQLLAPIILEDKNQEE